MQKLTIKYQKKPGIHLNFRLKRQTHPWDMIGELAKAKQLDQTAKTHSVPPKHFPKNSFSLTEEPSIQLNEILVTPHKASRELDIEDNLQLVDEAEEAYEGFFPCPACTCWFTNKRDLVLHIKRWCDKQANPKLIFSAQTK